MASSSLKNAGLRWASFWPKTKTRTRTVIRSFVFPEIGRRAPSRNNSFHRTVDDVSRRFATHVPVSTPAAYHKADTYTDGWPLARWAELSPRGGWLVPSPSLSLVLLVHSFSQPLPLLLFLSPTRAARLDTGWPEGFGGTRGGAAAAARYKPVRVNNRPSDVIAPRDTSVAFKWLLSRLCLDADVDLWNSIKLHRIPYRPNRVVASRSKHPPDPNLSLSLRLLFSRPPACYCDFLCCS